MGDRYILTIDCPACGAVWDDVYYAPTCGFVEFECPGCEEVIDLEELTGISREDASNASVINGLITDIEANHLAQLTDNH